MPVGRSEFQMARRKSACIASAMHRDFSDRNAKASESSGRWFLVFTGLSLVLIGGLFVWLMARSFLRAQEMRSWPEVECVILASSLDERRHDDHSPLEFRLNVLFGYEWEGEARSGDRLSLRGSPWSSKRVLAEERAAEFPVGKKTTCRVNPANPELAVLKPDSLAPGYSIWFPSLFVIGGLVMCYRALRRPRSSS
jgi:hypothetical protein